MTAPDAGAPATPSAPLKVVDTRDVGAVPKDSELDAAHGGADSRAREFFATCVDLERRINVFLGQNAVTVEGQDVASLRRTQNQTRRSMAIIREALDRYSLETLALSYNGGKDCLVLLILYLALLPSYFAASGTASRSASAAPSPPNATFTTLPPNFPASLPAVYIEASHPFGEVDSFVATTAECYHLNLVRHAGSQGLRAAFDSYLAQTPQVRAIFVGTRRTDPHGAMLEAFQTTDRGWPDFMRVHPVLEWRYADVWTFLREMRIPYCDLYDQGYTSLGGRLDTKPNPALRSSTDTEDLGFRPAYQLISDDSERLGRDS